MSTPGVSNEPDPTGGSKYEQPLRVEGFKGTPEEVDRQWFNEVYRGRGDSMPQLTLRAVLMGTALGGVLSLTNLYIGLKAGWAFGVTITACIVSYAVWSVFLRLGLAKTPMTILENNCMQSTSSSAGYSTGSTLVSAFAAYFMINGHPLPLGLTFAHFGSRPVPQLVEDSNAQRIQQPTRCVKGDTKACVTRCRQVDLLEVARCSMIAARENRPAHVCTTRHAINPGDRVVVKMVAFGHGGHHLVEVREALRVNQDLVGLNSQKLNGGGRDDAGESHGPYRAPEQVGVIRGRDAKRSRRRGDVHLTYVIRKGPVAVVVLSVHVGRDRTANGDLTRPWSHGNEPTLGD